MGTQLQNRCRLSPNPKCLIKIFTLCMQALNNGLNQKKIRFFRQRVAADKFHTFYEIGLGKRTAAVFCTRQHLPEHFVVSQPFNCIDVTNLAGDTTDSCDYWRTNDRTCSGIVGLRGTLQTAGVRHEINASFNGYQKNSRNFEEVPDVSAWNSNIYNQSCDPAPEVSSGDLFAAPAPDQHRRGRHHASVQ